MEIYSENYVRNLVDFLAAHRWIYDVKITNLFKEEFWNRIPAHWVTPMLQMTLQDLSHLPAGRVKSEWSDDLKSFVAKCVEYSLEREVDDVVVKAAVSIDASVCKGMNPKKQHEVSRLAGYLIQHCRECEVILDIGSGLGYLGQCLAQQCGKKVLGVECDSYRVDQGNRRHFDITTNQKTKPSQCTTTTAEPQEFQSFDKIRSCLECTTVTNAIVCDKRVASKSSNVCDNNVNKSTVACDYSIISDEGANKETLVSCECIVHLSLSMDGLPSTQKRCGCQATGDSRSEHSDDKCSNKHSAGLSDTMVARPIRRPPQSPTSFVTEHLSLNVTSECVQKLDELLKNFLTPGMERRVCVVGLHCCGDLAPAVLNYFVNSSPATSVHSVVLFGCCYHKMSSSCVEESNGGKGGSQFDHFPLSSLVKAVLNLPSHNKQQKFYFNTYAARLACQETRTRWLLQTDKDHCDHVRHVGYRAMFEAVVTTEDCNLKHYKQKINHKKNFDCWESYIDSALQDYQLTDTHHASVKRKLSKYHQGHHHYLSYIEPFTALQVCLQGVLEHLVILDRLLFLKEHHSHAASLPIFDDHISPRNTAIVSHKHTKPL